MTIKARLLISVTNIINTGQQIKSKSKSGVQNETIKSIEISYDQQNETPSVIQTPKTPRQSEAASTRSLLERQITKPQIQTVYPINAEFQGIQDQSTPLFPTQNLHEQNKVQNQQDQPNQPLSDRKINFSNYPNQHPNSQNIGDGSYFSFGQKLPSFEQLQVHTIEEAIKKDFQEGNKTLSLKSQEEAKDPNQLTLNFHQEQLSDITQESQESEESSNAQLNTQNQKRKKKPYIPKE